MPKAFEDCVRRGGTVRTETLSGGRYRKVCYIGGRKYLGHIQTKKRGVRKRGRSKS
jgi:hypothetical protein